MNTERLKGWLSSSSKLVAASAQLAKKQAELATLNNVTLPRLYHAIGKRLIGSSNLPPDLVPHREKIRDLEAAIAKTPEKPAAEPASGFAAKAKHLAQQAASKTAKATADAAATVKIQAAYVALGKQAIEKQALPRDLREQHEATMQKQAALADEISGLNSAPGKGFVTPGRLAIFGGVVCLLLGWWTLRGATLLLFSQPAQVVAAVNIPREETLSKSKLASNQTVTADAEDDEVISVSGTSDLADSEKRSLKATGRQPNPSEPRRPRISKAKPPRAMLTSPQLGASEDQLRKRFGEPYLVQDKSVEVPLCDKTLSFDVDEGDLSWFIIALMSEGKCVEVVYKLYHIPTKAFLELVPPQQAMIEPLIAVNAQGARWEEVPFAGLSQDTFATYWERSDRRAIAYVKKGDFTQLYISDTAWLRSTHAVSRSLE